MNQVFDEWVLQSRLHYLGFKRSVWMFELCMLFCLYLVLHVCKVSAPWSTFLMGLQSARVAGEMWNHYHLSHVFKAPDRWTWFPFI